MTVVLSAVLVAPVAVEVAAVPMGNPKAVVVAAAPPPAAGRNLKPKGNKAIPMFA